MLRGIGGAAKELRETIEPLWVSGLALLQLIFIGRLLGSRFVGLSGESYEWAQYLLYGTLFPLLVLLLSLLLRRAPRWLMPAPLVRLGLALCCPAIIGYY